MTNRVYCIGQKNSRGGDVENSDHKKTDRVFFTMGKEKEEVEI